MASRGRTTAPGLSYETIRRRDSRTTESKSGDGDQQRRPERGRRAGFQPALRRGLHPQVRPQETRTGDVQSRGDQWTAHWALPIPDDTQTLPKKSPDDPDVAIAIWEYGTVAQVLHLGPYSEEGPTIAALHKFIGESGYRIIGEHEEEYLTSPKAKVMKTIIRYRVAEL
jgi:hypothetical protein